MHHKRQNVEYADNDSKQNDVNKQSSQFSTICYSVSEFEIFGLKQKSFWTKDFIFTRDLQI